MLDCRAAWLMKNQRNSAKLRLTRCRRNEKFPRVWEAVEEEGGGGGEQEDENRAESVSEQRRKREE